MDRAKKENRKLWRQTHLPKGSPYPIVDQTQEIDLPKARKSLNYGMGYQSSREVPFAKESFPQLGDFFPKSGL